MVKMVIVLVRYDTKCLKESLLAGSNPAHCLIINLDRKRMMNKTEARYIAETITNEEIETMISVAKDSIKDWTARSIVNKSFSKGLAWNILANAFDVNHKYHKIAKVNFLREYGEYLPKELRVTPSRPKTVPPEIQHAEPIFKKESK